MPHNILTAITVASLKGGLCLGTLGTTTHLAMVPFLDDAKALTSLGVSGLCALIAIVCVWALVKTAQSKDAEQREHAQKLYVMIESATKASEAQKVATEQTSSLLVEVKGAMSTVSQQRATCEKLHSFLLGQSSAANPK